MDIPIGPLSPKTLRIIRNDLQIAYEEIPDPQANIIVKTGAGNIAMAIVEISIILGDLAMLYDPAGDDTPSRSDDIAAE